MRDFYNESQEFLATAEKLHKNLFDAIQQYEKAVQTLDKGHPKLKELAEKTNECEEVLSDHFLKAPQADLPF